MRPAGFSTGALAKGDFRRGLELQSQNPRITAIELSALREGELSALASSARTLSLSHFNYVSIHAPSRLVAVDERQAFDMLVSLPETWPIIAHPELLRTPDLWQGLGPRLCVENMDNRKTTGRTVSEMRDLFELYPQAGFCLDLGHARQIDPTMATAICMLREFGDRLRQVHVSEVGPHGEHRPLSSLAVYAYALIVDLVPEECPLIIESVILPEQIEREIDKTLRLFAFRGSQDRAAFAFSAAAALE